MRNHGQSKFEQRWKGPFVIADVGFPGTYWLMQMDGRRLDNTVNQAELAPWLAQADDIPTNSLEVEPNYNADSLEVEPHYNADSSDGLSCSSKQL